MAQITLPQVATGVNLDSVDPKVATEIFCAWDGDHVGRLAGDAVLHDQPEELARVSAAIDRGNRVFVEWATACLGRLVQTAGDEGVVVVPAAALADLPTIMREYETAVGATVSVGVGARLSEAGKARLVAKLRGGDGVAVWDEEMTDELQRLLHGEPKTETEKLAQEYGDALKGEGEGVQTLIIKGRGMDETGGMADLVEAVCKNASGGHSFQVVMDEDLRKDIEKNGGRCDFFLDGDGAFRPREVSLDGDVRFQVKTVREFVTEKSEQSMTTVPRAPSTNGDANGGPATPANLPIAAADPVSPETPMVEGVLNPDVPVSAGLVQGLQDAAAGAIAPVPEDVLAPTLQDRVRELVRARELQDHADQNDSDAQADALRERLAGIMKNLHGRRADMEALVRSSPGVATSLGELLAAVRDLAAVGKRPPTPLGKSAKGQGGSEVGREHVVRPVGTIQDGKVKVETPNGESWRQARSGLVAAANGTPTSARNPHPKTGELTVS